MQYLKITRVPIKITRTVEPAKVKTIVPARATVQLKTKASKLKVTSKSAKVKMDNFENLSEMGGGKSAKALSRSFAEKGMQAAQEATGEYTSIGNELANITKNGKSIPDITRQRMTPDYIPTGLKFVPSKGPKIDWEPATVSFDYDPAVLTKTPDVAAPHTKYVPSSINVKIDQYPSVKIEYVGEPIYVPPSANPNYEPTLAEKLAEKNSFKGEKYTEEKMREKKMPFDYNEDK